VTLNSADRWSTKKVTRDRKADIQSALVKRAILQHCFLWFGNNGADAAIAILLPTLTLKTLN